MPFRDSEYLADGFSKSLEEGITDVVGEMGDYSLISILKNTDYEGIPFVSTVIAGLKIGKSFSELSHLANLSRFIEKIKSNICDEEERQKYINLFNKKSKKKEKQRIRICCDNYIKIYTRQKS